MKCGTGKEEKEEQEGWSKTKAVGEGKSREGETDGLVDGSVGVFMVA